MTNAIKKDTKKLLEVRKAIKSKKPIFTQQDYHKKRRLSLKWKRPTGLQSKMRHQFKGYSRRVKQGWRSPVEIRDFHGKGIASVLIHSLKDLDTVKSGTGIIIAKDVGLRKKQLILDKAQQLKITVINITPENFKKKIEQRKLKIEEEKKLREDKKKKTLEDSLKKAEKAKKDKEKHEKELAAEKSDEKKSEKSEEKSEDEKKAEERKEQEKVLIHNQ